MYTIFYAEILFFRGPIFGSGVKVVGGFNWTNKNISSYISNKIIAMKFLKRRYLKESPFNSLLLNCTTSGTPKV